MMAVLSSRPVVVYGMETRECILSIQDAEAMPIAEERPDLSPELERLVATPHPSAAQVAVECRLAAKILR